MTQPKAILAAAKRIIKNPEGASVSDILIVAKGYVELKDTLSTARAKWKKKLEELKKVIEGIF